VNPWHDVQLPDDAVESPSTLHYTIGEAENIVSALVDRADCQLIVALACFLGLRPGEIEGCGGKILIPTVCIYVAVLCAAFWALRKPPSP
jgi:heme/copper-type cytochrome/quinol oxidase subunit 4